MGYQPFEEKMKFNKNQSIGRDFKLFTTSITTGELNIVADREVETRQISISTVNVPVSQIKEIRIGGESDAFRSLQMLPGVLTSSLISNGFNIRCGSPDQIWGYNITVENIFFLF